jgi:hypothetical protein
MPCFTVWVFKIIVFVSSRPWRRARLITNQRGFGTIAQALIKGMIASMGEFLRSNRQTANPAAGRSSMDPATADKAEKKKRVWHRRDEAGRSAGLHVSHSNGRAVGLHDQRNNAKE